MAHGDTGITAIITTYGRGMKLLDTIARIEACDPPPDAVLVHVDNGDAETVRLLTERRPDVPFLLSEEQLGPGGGRHRLLHSVETRYAASFDDDSYPLDTDYFARVRALFGAHPHAAVLAAVIYDPEVPPVPETDEPERWTSDFVGCGCAYDVARYHELPGYLPAPVGYGIEETDLALQVLDREWGVLDCPSLRIYHDTDYTHRQATRVVADSIANRVVQLYVRYPVRAWGWGGLQYLNAIRWFASRGRVDGVIDGLFRTPVLVRRFASYRGPVRTETIEAYKRLRDNKPAAEPSTSIE